MSEQTITILFQRIDRIEAVLTKLAERSAVREWYTIKEFATIVGKAEFTCQSWCRNGRIKAAKRNSGRGKFHEWVVSHEELERYQREGLLQPKH